MKEDYKKTFFQILVVLSLVISNLVALKLGEIYGLVLYSSIFIFPFTFLGISLLNDWYGKKAAITTMLMAIVFQLLLLIPYSLVVNMPAQSLIYDFAGEVGTVFSYDSSILVSSLISFAVAQLINIYTFDFMKKNSYKILGCALGILFGLVADSLIFVLLSGWGMPGYALVTKLYSQVTASVFVTMILTVVYAVCILPFYKRKKNVKKDEKEEHKTPQKTKPVKKNVKK